MISGISNHFPYYLVDLCTFITLLPLSILFYYESLTNKLHLRWDAPILGLSLSKEDYRSEMFKDGTRICCFVVWTLQLIFNMYIIYYHLTRPHHPKFYSTFKNKFALVVHMISELRASGYPGYRALPRCAVARHRHRAARSGTTSEG